MIIYIDGKYCDFSEKESERLAPGAVARQGVFETMLFSEGKVVDFSLHEKRFVRGLKLYKLNPRVSFGEAEKIIYQLVKKNQLDAARVRIAQWSENKKVRIAIVAVPQKSLLDAKGLHAGIAPFVRNRTRTSHIKSMDYGVFREAYLWAVQNKYDEAFLLNSAGYVVEGSRTNIFFVKDNVVFTPAVFCGCLNGIMRQRILKIIQRMGIEHAIGNFTVKDLITADEIFLTNSCGGILPVTYVDGKKISNGSIGVVTSNLRKIHQSQ